MAHTVRSNSGTPTSSVNWIGKWVWIPECANYPWRNAYAMFRRRMSAGGEIIINVAADNRYELYFDGARVDRGSASSAAGYQTFDAHYVSAQPGEHVIAVLVHHVGETCATSLKSRPGLLVQVTWGQAGCIGSDCSWKALHARAFEQDLPCMMSHFGFYEVLDYTRMPSGWTDIDFDDAGWYDAEIVGEVGCKPWGQVTPRDIPNLGTTTLDIRRIIATGSYADAGMAETPADEMANRHRNVFAETYVDFPIRLGASENGFVVLDFGREVTGNVQISFDGAADGQQVDIGYDEILDGRRLPNPRRTYVKFADRFFVRKDQRELDVFDGRGFRYLLVDVPSGKGGIAITGVRIDERTYPVDTTATFHCSDPTLDMLYQVGIETTRLCMLDSYVDCPSRERVTWMDSYLAGMCSSYSMGVTDLWRRVLYLYAQNTCRTGELAGLVKGYVLTDSDHPCVDTYAMYYACSVADYVLHTGNLAVGEELFPIVMEQFRVLYQYMTPQGIYGDRFPGWGSFLDWSAMDHGGISAGDNAILLIALRKGQRLARLLGKTAEADRLAAKRADLLTAYSDAFWSEKKGLFVDALRDGKHGDVLSQLVNTLAIWAGVVDGDEARDIVRRITNPDTLLPLTPGDYRLQPDFKCHTGGIVPIGTPALGTVLAMVMFNLGMDSEAMDYLRTAWPPLVVNGTFAEHFEFDANTSMCHAWSAGPTLLLPRYVLGVRPLTPGWTTVEVTPHPGNLTWAEGSVMTPLGEIRVAWRVLKEGVKLDVELPKGITLAGGNSPLCPPETCSSISRSTVVGAASNRRSH